MQSKDYKGLIYFENNGIYFKILETMKILIWASPVPYCHLLGLTSTIVPTKEECSIMLLRKLLQKWKAGMLGMEKA